MAPQNDGASGKETPARVRVIRDGLAAHLPDIDPEETAEWLDSFDEALARGGQQRARYLMLRILERARERHIGVPALTSTDYVNTIPTENEPWFPGDEEIERRYRAYIRWNAAIMVHRAQRPGVGVGGHISTYASSAALYEVGFNHFFRGKDHSGGGDHDLPPGPRLPRHLRPRVPRGPAERAAARRLPPGVLARRRGRRPAVVPAPAADAGVLGVPDGVDGPRPDERDLPGAVQPLPA